MPGILEHWIETISRYGIYGLALNSFIEAIFFPIPPDILLIALCIANRQNALMYALVATLFSSFGGVGGYFTGYFGGKPLAVRFFGEERVNRMHNLFQSYEGLIILIAGFTPLPYKLFTITSGVLFVSLYRLIVFSVIGRGTRFFLEALLIKLYGERMANFVKFNLNIVLTIAGILVIAIFVFRQKFTKGSTGES